MYICADLYAHFHFELGDGSYYILLELKELLVIIVCLVCFMPTLLNTTRKSF